MGLLVGVGQSSTGDGTPAWGGLWFYGPSSTEKHLPTPTRDGGGFRGWVRVYWRTRSS
jgi:hypothetical protein